MRAAFAVCCLLFVTSTCSQPQTPQAVPSRSPPAGSQESPGDSQGGFQQGQESAFAFPGVDSLIDNAVAARTPNTQLQQYINQALQQADANLEQLMPATTDSGLRELTPQEVVESGGGSSVNGHPPQYNTSWSPPPYTLPLSSPSVPAAAYGSQTPPYQRWDQSEKELWDLDWSNMMPGMTSGMMSGIMPTFPNSNTLPPNAFPPSDALDGLASLVGSSLSRMLSSGPAAVESAFSASVPSKSSSHEEFAPPAGEPASSLPSFFVGMMNRLGEDVTRISNKITQDPLQAAREVSAYALQQPDVKSIVDDLPSTQKLAADFENILGTMVKASEVNNSATLKEDRMIQEELKKELKEFRSDPWAAINDTLVSMMSGQQALSKDEAAVQEAWKTSQFAKNIMANAETQGQRVAHQIINSTVSQIAISTSPLIQYPRFAMDGFSGINPRRLATPPPNFMPRRKYN